MYIRAVLRRLVGLAAVCSLLVESVNASCAACCASPSNATVCADASPLGTSGKCCGYNGNNVSSPVCCTTLDTCRYSTDTSNLPAYTCSLGISSCFSCCSGDSQSCSTAYKGAGGVCCGLIRSTAFCCGNSKDYPAYQYPMCTASSSAPSFVCEVPEVSESVKLAWGLGFGIPLFLILICVWFFCCRNGSSSIQSSGTTLFCSIFLGSTFERTFMF